MFILLLRQLEVFKKNLESVLISEDEHQRAMVQ